MKRDKIWIRAYCNGLVMLVLSIMLQMTVVEDVFFYIGLLLVAVSSIMLLIYDVFGIFGGN